MKNIIIKYIVAKMGESMKPRYKQEAIAQYLTNGMKLFVHFIVKDKLGFNGMPIRFYHYFT